MIALLLLCTQAHAAPPLIGPKPSPTPAYLFDYHSMYNVTPPDDLVKNKDGYSLDSNGRPYYIAVELSYDAKGNRVWRIYQKYVDE